MQYIWNQMIFFFSFFSLVVSNFSFGTYEDQKKMGMIQDLEMIKHHYEIGYAPAKWKKEYAEWDLEKAFEDAKNQILAPSFITTKEFQIIVRNFINTMKDYHVDVLFFSTESASLPFGVKGVEGRYFIDWIDSLRLPSSLYSIKVGDELLEFDESPIREIIDEIKRENSKSATSETDQSLAEVKLTFRSGVAGDRVPQGPILIKIRSKDSHKLKTYQLCWSYTPEYVKNVLDFIPPLNFISKFMSVETSKKNKKLPKMTMANPLHQLYAKQSINRKGDLGSNKSFIPVLGETLWVKEQEKDQDNQDEKIIDWYAYIYRHPEGASVGYIRIPHYVAYQPEAKEFGEILNMMEENTDVLVIDQVHNFGGYIDFQYELASMLAIEPLKAPYHCVKITQKDVLEAYDTLEFIKLMELLLVDSDADSNSNPPPNEENDKEKEAEENDDSMDGMNYQKMMFLKNYYQLILDEWNKGHTLTDPTPILGIDRINPHPKYQYTKPILMLINEMDFSGGDFMPAILQDNQRALLFGCRTAGAGGFVFSFEFPNRNGIALCSYTASIAERANLEKIENLGVSPDIEYQVTVEDLQQNYSGYVNGVNQAVKRLLDKK